MNHWNRRDFLLRVPSIAVGATALANLTEPALKGFQIPGVGEPTSLSTNKIDDRIERVELNFRAEDGGHSSGAYYRLKGKNPKTAVLLMHPNGNNQNHFLAGRLAAYGYGVLGAGGRWATNHPPAIPDETLLDIAAQIKFLKENYHIEHFVAVGHSGGGGLFAFYQGQAITRPPGRFSATPGGDPPDLNKFDLPPFDGIVMFAAHAGEGKILGDRMDPSVVDEDDPLATDWTLDMYDPRNGYRKPPESSKYSPEFIARHRAAQLDRCRRIDRKAFELIARQRRAEELMKSPGFASLDPQDQILIRRTSYFEPFMTIYRTAAMPTMTDLSIDPSERRVGDGTDPEEANFLGWKGEASVMTARGYLATWSAEYSHMESIGNLAKITAPTLVTGAAGDLDIIPRTVRAEYQASAAKDKTIVFVKAANHYFVPIEPAAGGKNKQDEGAQVVADWLRPRFPV